MLETLWTLPHGAVVQAGAGTGKTHSLVTLCLHLLSGAGREAPLAPGRLWAVTFTEKAAAELTGRLRQRVDALAEGGQGEPELLATLRGQLPAPSFWRKLRHDLSLAQVGTIHGLCGQILRRHAATAGIDPGFAVLDEAQGRRVLVEACEAVALRALEGELGPEADAAARRLCAEMGLRMQGKFGAGLADELVALVSRLGESGRDPAALVRETEGLSARATLQADAQAREAVRRSMELLRQALPQGGSGKNAALAVQCVAAFRDARLDYAPGALESVWPALVRASALPAASGPLGEHIAAAKAAFDALVEADAGVRASALAVDLGLLAGHAQARHRDEKRRLGALDFDDLTRLCRDLLRDVPAARDAERARLGVLLVDEFQDTSRPQLQLFTLLLGSPARPGSLVVVGDRKQSIYEFRGADVAGAQAFAGQALAEGAEKHVLRESRRSRPALVGFANLLFGKALAASDHAFDTPFTGDDALVAHRPGGPGGACAELLHVTGAGVEAEAEVVARRLAALLAPGAPERVFGKGEAARPVRGGDVAILLRRFTNLETFRRALLRRRIPHLIWKGRGFHDAREIMDLRALLSCAADPEDTLSLAAVLRSPLGPVSDDGLVLLSAGRRLRRSALEDPALLESLSADDAEAALRLGKLLHALEREVERLGPSALLEAALAQTDYLARCAGGLYGEQAAANLDKLLHLARTAELRGESVRAFTASLRALADEQAREPEAPVAEESDPHAVRLMTVHAAKGLEFPVVFVPECATPSFKAGPERTLLDPDLGLCLKVRAADGDKRRSGVHGVSVQARRQERELSQSRRLLYVAVTRARDLVVLSGRKAAPAESWRRWIDQVAAPAAAQGLLRVLDDGGPAQLTGLPPLHPAAPRGADDAPSGTNPAPPHGAGHALPRQAALEPPEGFPELIARLAQPAAGAPALVSAPVTQLADAVACPRRYQLLHELRLEERPGAADPRGDPLDPDRPATALGTLAHRLLELIPLQLDAGARRAELTRLLQLEGEDPAQHAEVIDGACAFLDSPLGQRMAAAGGAPRLERELPFALRLSPGLVMRGQIDALLLESDAATVVDYKLSQARDTARYAAQLDAYALAASELVQGALPVKAGIVFLRTKGAPFAARPLPDLARVRSELLAAGRAIAEGRRSGSWPKVRPEKCEALGCGFFQRCHPSPEAPAG